MNIDALSPEQTKALLSSLLGAAGDGTPPSMSMGPSSGMDNPDEAADRALIQDEVKDYMVSVGNGMEVLAQMVQALQSQVDDLVSGLRNVLDARTRYAIQQESLSKYGEMFQPFADAVKEIDGSDLMEDLVNIISEIREGPDYTPEYETDTINQLHQSLADKMNKIRGVQSAPAEEEPIPEEPPVTEAKPTEVTVEKTIAGPDIEGIRRTAAKLKAARTTSV